MLCCYSHFPCTSAKVSKWVGSSAAIEQNKTSPVSKIQNRRWLLTKIFLLNCCYIAVSLTDSPTEYLFLSASLPKVDVCSVHWVALYCLLGNAVNVFQYASVHFLPLGTTGCVLRAMQFFTVVAASRVFLGESITGTKILTLLLCITGQCLRSEYTGSRLERAGGCS